MVGLNQASVSADMCYNKNEMDAELTNNEIVGRIVKAHNENRLKWVYLEETAYAQAYGCKGGEYYIILVKDQLRLPFPGKWMLEISKRNTDDNLSSTQQWETRDKRQITKPQRPLAALGKELERTIGPKDKALKLTESSFLS